MYNIGNLRLWEVTMFTGSRIFAVSLKKAWLWCIMAIVLVLPAATRANEQFTPAELDTLVSTIALYPDPLLVQVLAASVHGDEIPGAADWANQNKHLKGQELADRIKLEDLPYDESVQALIPFPTVLATMAKYQVWTDQLGDGDKTYETPRFFADLYDLNGINTAGAGIGHDLMLIIDDEAKMTYTLNEYFTAANNSYQAGQVSYLMEALPNGPHSLMFRAWDLLNNSTTQVLNFIVEAGLDPSIYSITTYPNPVQSTGVLNLVVNYDQPDELLQTEIYLYNTSGQMLWSHTQQNPDRVVINLADLGLTAGVYVYSVRIKSASSGYSASSGKIIVTR